MVKHKLEFKKNLGRDAWKWENNEGSEVRSLTGSDFDKPKILSQLDAIGECLSIIKNSASAAWPEDKISVCDMATVSSSLPEGNMHASLPDLHTLRHDRLIQEQVEDYIRQLSNC